MGQSDSLLMVFVKNPVKGQVKTRLAASVGPERALSIYQRLLEHTRLTVRPLDAQIQVWYSDGVPESSRWSSVADEMLEQRGKDLGERMRRAFRDAFDQGYRKVVIIGSDCAEIRTDHLEDAFRSLEECDVVIGPAADGGYYLLGMTRMTGALFRDKSWGTDSVLGETLKELRDLGIECHLLPELNDVDRLEDWEQSKDSLRTE